MQLNGIIKNIYETEQVSDKFKKRTFVLATYKGDFENLIALEATQDRVNMLDNVNIGDSVTAHIDVRSREYNGKWYTQVQCWKIDTVAKTEPAKTDYKELSPTDNDLPF